MECQYWPKRDGPENLAKRADFLVILNRDYELPGRFPSRKRAYRIGPLGKVA